MTGLDALVEAARQEAARVYGTVHREHRQPIDQGRPALTPRRPTVELDPQIIALAGAGQSPAAIAFRLGISKRHVTEALTRRRTG